MHCCDDIRRHLDALTDNLNALHEKMDCVEGQIAAILRALRPHQPAIRLIEGVVFKIESGEIVMSGTTSTTYTLTNAANPAAATRFLGVEDIVGGTTVPTITSSDPTKLAIVVGTLSAASATGTSLLNWGAYPLDAAAETNDAVTVTLALPGGETEVIDFVISGAPVPPPAPETFADDPTSAIGAWAGAPAVPATPV
jgi:hypothetical protein